MMRWVVAASAVCTVVCLGRGAAAQTTGGIRGRVTDAATDAVIGGVVIVARSPALQGEETAVTDAAGAFALPLLPPGTYALHFEGPDHRVEEMRDVHVQLGSTTPVTVQLVPTRIEAGRIVVTSSAPVVDRGSTEIGANLDHELIGATPSARRYSQVLQQAPGASSDSWGTTIFGSTSVENTYIVEGLNTTEVGFGRAGADMNTDFFEEIEVKTGGYLPEFGRSTGGIFNLVLRNGSNDLHGEVFVNVAPGFLQARPIPIDRAREAIGRSDEPDFTLDAGFDLGGPILRDRLWFFGGFNLERRQSTVHRLTRTRIDEVTQDGDGEVTARRPDDVEDVDDDGLPVMRQLGDEELDRDRTTYLLAGKLTFALTPYHRLSASYFGNPEVSTGVILRSDEDNLGNNGVAGEPSWYGPSERTFGSHNVMLSYAGQLLEGHLQVEAFAGVHASHNVALPTTAGQRLGMVDHAYPTSLSTFEPGTCPERDDTPFVDCPVSEYRTGGMGFFRDEQLSRTTAGFRLTNLFHGHRIRYGFDTELKSFSATRGYTGDAAAWETHYAPTAADDPNLMTHTQLSFARPNPDDPNNPIVLGRDNEPPFRADVTTLTLSAFLQDQWEIDRYFTLNAGLRWDYEQFGGTAEEPLVTIPDELAPRLGFSFDPTGRGRARLFASWGMFYESVPMDLNQRAASREGLVFRFVDDDGHTVCFDTEGRPVPGGSPPECTYDPYGMIGGQYAAVANDLGGQFHEEFVVGGEVELVPNWVVGAQAVSRRLGRVIEDVSPNNGNNYFLANPGVNDCDVDEQYRAALAESCGEDRDGDGTISPDEYDPSATVFPEPVRTYLGLVFSVRKRLADHSQLLASYTLSRTYGDYPGLYSPDNQQLDPNISSQYDLPDLLPNRLGLLPNDHTHTLKLLGSYELGGLVQALRGLTVGLSYRGESGVPYSYLGRHQSYGRNEAFILPRGSAGRTPFTHQVDAAIGYDIPIAGSVKLNLNTTVLNVFNFQEPLLVDQEYTTDVVLPHAPGTPLRELRNSDGEPVNVNPVFGQARARQMPLWVQVGARLSF